jgi:hypothetical protein
MMSLLAVLCTALLFGGMTLYSFGFAAFLFAALPANTARAALRQAFPWFYVFVLATSVTSAVLWWQRDGAAATAMAIIAATTVPTRQLLMPMINRASDANLRGRFQWLHGLSVVITLAHMALAAWVLSKLA